jgi:integrase
LGDIVRKTGRDGRFIGWYIRYKDESGRRRQRATHQPSKELARRVLVDVEARIVRGEIGAAAALGPATVALLFQVFLDEFRSPRMKDLKSYRRDARLGLSRLLPFIGERPLRELSRRDVERARDALSARYRPNTVRATLRPLGTALSWAVRRGWLVVNPLRGLELPRAEKSVERLTSEEAKALLGAAEAQAAATHTPVRRLAARVREVAVALALHLGLRRGEIFGLRWQDLDLEAARATIARSYRGSPKNGRSRHLPLPVALISRLRSWRAECPLTADGLVCPVYAAGWKLSARSKDAGLMALARAAGIRRFERGWHALRHTFASQFVMSGGSLLALQKILGHSTVEMTMIYAHLAPDFLAGELDKVKY